MAGQETWAEAPAAMADARVHRGYAAAYRSVLAEVENAVAAWARESAAGETESKSTPRVVVVGHSLGGALAALCAARLAHEPDVLTLADRDAPAAAAESAAAESAAAAVECVTFGQPRVGDSAFRRGVDDASRLNYTRVVRGGDLFARVPTSGFWLPSGNGDQYSVEYSHAGSLVDGRGLRRRREEGRVGARGIQLGRTDDEPGGGGDGSRGIRVFFRRRRPASRVAFRGGVAMRRR